MTTMKLPFRLEMRHKIALGLTGGLAALILAVRFVYLPVFGAVGEKRATLLELKTKVADTTVLAARLPQEEAALAQAQKEYQAFLQRIGEEQSVARILDLLGKQAAGYRLQIVLLQQRADEGAPPRTLTLGPQLTLREVPLTLKLTGRYRQFGEFLGTLAEAPFIAAVKDVKLARVKAGEPDLEADMVLAVYVADRSAVP